MTIITENQKQSGYLPSEKGGIAKEWKSFEGTLKTLPNDKTATLLVQMWWNTKYGPMKYKVGDYILVDDVIIEEVH